MRRFSSSVSPYVVSSVVDPCECISSVVRVKICGLTRVDEAAGVPSRWAPCGSGLTFIRSRRRRYVPPGGSRRERRPCCRRLPLPLLGSSSTSPPRRSRGGRGTTRAQDCPVARAGTTRRPGRTARPVSDRPGLPVWMGRPAWSGVTDYLVRARALGRLPDAVLIDAYVAGQSGGTGATIRARASRLRTPRAPPDPGRWSYAPERRRAYRSGPPLDGRRREWRRESTGSEGSRASRRLHPRGSPRRLLRSGAYEDRATVRISPRVLQVEPARSSSH